jgi:hypothetical protein
LPIFNQRSPIYQRGHDSRQYQRCDHHLKDHKTGRISADKPTRNISASIQEQVSRPSEPIEHDSLHGNVAIAIIFPLLRIDFRQCSSNRMPSPAKFMMAVEMCLSSNNVAYGLKRTLRHTGIQEECHDGP